MREIKKLTNAIRNYAEADLDYGTLKTLKMIDDDANKLKAQLAAKEAELVQARKLNEFWEDQAGSFEAQLMGANKELVQAREKIDLLKSLIDGAKDLVELFETVTPAQRKWKDNWLRKAWEALK